MPIGCPSITVCDFSASLPAPVLSLGVLRRNENKAQDKDQFPRIGDLEDKILPRQQGHAMLSAALQGIGLKLSAHFIRGEPAAFPGDQVAQDTDFIVN